MLINQPMSANVAGNGITPRIKNQKPSFHAHTTQIPISYPTCSKIHVFRMQ